MMTKDSIIQSAASPTHGSWQKNSTSNMNLIASTIILSIALSFCSFGGVDGCSNDDDYTFRGQRGTTCKWIRFTEENRLKYCPKQEVAESCPESCGHCCENENETSNKFKTKDEENGEQPCSWLDEDEARKVMYCNKWSNGRMVRDGCTVSCSYCQEEIPVRDCLDNPSYKLITKKGRKKPCEWIRENIWRKNQYCSTINNGYEVNSVCAESCQSCADFSITLVNAGDNTNYDQAFVKAKKRWESIIIGDLSNTANPGGLDFFVDLLSVNYTGSVDDIVIGYEISYIDGPGETIGYAGPIYYRPTYAPLSGVMIFDEDDFASYANDDIDVIIMHEMGHVLGLVDSFNTCNGGCNQSGDYEYKCPIAQAAYEELFPGGNLMLEDDGGNGTECHHWDDDNFPVNEPGATDLMIGNFEPGEAQLLTTISLAALADQSEEYVIDYSQADPYPTTKGRRIAAGPVWEVLRPKSAFSLRGKIVYTEPIPFLPLD